MLSRGIAMFRVVVHGTQAHSSLSDRLPMVNATVTMAHLIDRMDRELKQHLSYVPHRLVPGGPTVNVGVMAKAGTFYGVNPGLAEFACDLRTLPGMSRESVERDLQGFLSMAMKDDPVLDAELIFEKWLPATEIGADDAASIAGTLLARSWAKCCLLGLFQERQMQHIFSSAAVYRPWRHLGRATSLEPINRTSPCQWAASSRRQKSML